MKRALIVLAVLALPWAMAGCGEKLAVTNYKAGQYNGKPDMRPWDNDQFKGDKAAWEQTVKARNESQNEYKRVSGG